MESLLNLQPSSGWKRWGSCKEQDLALSFLLHPFLYVCVSYTKAHMMMVLIISRHSSEWKSNWKKRSLSPQSQAGFSYNVHFSMQSCHSVYTCPPLFILLHSAYRAIKPAILLLRDKANSSNTAESLVSFPFLSAHCALRISVFAIIRVSFLDAL